MDFLKDVIGICFNYLRNPRASSIDVLEDAVVISYNFLRNSKTYLMEYPT